MIKNVESKLNRPKSQTEVDENILNFLGTSKITTSSDLVLLKDKVLGALKSRPYNDETKEHADSIQWTRTASEIISDGYVYYGKACSDLAVVFLTLCKALGVEGRLVKLRGTTDDDSHSIVEVLLKDKWFRIDPSSRDSIPFEGELTSESIWNKKFKVWKKGRDVWDLGLYDIESEREIYK